MENNQAFEHLQVIRTLMERSALYRRALAPIMTFAGAAGLIAAAFGCLAKVEGIRQFVPYWFLVAGLALTGCLLLVRKQSLKEREPFWSPPTRRIASAMFPALLAGLIIGVGSAMLAHGEFLALVLPGLWSMFYGLALHAAGFFTPRGLRWFGWLLLIAGVLLSGSPVMFSDQPAIPAAYRPHIAMGLLFGALQLGYGIYLYFTERPATQP